MLQENSQEGSWLRINCLKSIKRTSISWKFWRIIRWTTKFSKFHSLLWFSLEPIVRYSVRQRITEGEAEETNDIAPAQDAGGPGRGDDNAFHAPQVPVVDTATQEATTQEDEPEDIGSGSDEDSEDDDRIEELRGAVEDVVKQLAGIKKKKRRRKVKRLKEGR